MTKRLRELWLDDVGQGLTEYVLLVALIALVTVAAMTGVAAVISQVWSNAARNLSSAI
jgi:Flp pilus assembly pilin Flp